MLDTNRQTGSSAACLKSLGIDFVLRYYCPNPSNPKVLTAIEAANLASANLEIGVIYEDSPVGAVVDYYTNAQGQTNGQNAWTIAQRLGQPTTSCIYFAIDFDAQPAEIPAILDYFRGVQTGMQSAAGIAPIYLIGVYGSGLVCQSIKQDNALATFSMLSLSTDWAGSKTYGGWDINQANATSPLCNFGINAWDEDQAQDNFGGFFYQAGVSLAKANINRDLVTAIESLSDEAKAWRRTLHQHPQTMYEEDFASNFICEKLTEWGIPHTKGIAKTGVVATIQGRRDQSGRSIAFRADIDALIPFFIRPPLSSHLFLMWLIQ